ncbi:MAG: hypothetical protein K5682_05400, partial [Lachnospiraceae bacterium]|nr:hypothetical protein [Lachnospiraceae bacterium]
NSVSRIWSVSLFLLFLILLVLGWIRIARQHHYPAKYAYLMVIVIFAHFGWGSALQKLNQGMFVLLFIFGALLIEEYMTPSVKKDLFTGLLMAFAMIKPQISLLFFIPFLLKKRIRPIFVSVLTVLLSWGIVSLVLQTSPITLLLDQFQVGADLETTSSYVYYGLLDPLVPLLGSKWVLVLQALVFIPVAFILGIRMQKAPAYILYAIPATLTTVWCYHHNMDLAIISILLIAVALTIQQGSLQQYVPLLALFGLFYLLPISYSYYEISFWIPLIQRLIYLGMLCFILRIVCKYRELYFAL